jgi:hypothetical protein
MEINKKNSALILLTLVAFASLLGGVLVTIHASDANSTDSNVTTATIGNLGLGLGETFGSCPRFSRHGIGGFGAIEISSEYNQTVTNIAENDSDVQNLIAQGYVINGVRPIVKNVVDGQGIVTTKATTAIVVLTKDTSGYARALVDIDQSKVTEIVILTRTVIQK